MTLAFDEDALAIVRRAYARQLVISAAFEGDARLERAIAETPREAFLGPGPWRVTKGVGYKDAPAEPALVYQDVLIALKPDKQINNGSPSLHANWLHAAQVKDGESVVHIGAGGGYYTAILAHLVGSQGRVTAIEFDADLAALARNNLTAYPNVSVVNGDGADWPRESADLVYVNFAVDRPAPTWIDKLKPGGRLIFPLGTIARQQGDRAYGAAFCVTSLGRDDVFAVRSLGSAFFVRAAGDPALIAVDAEREALLTAFEKGGFYDVKSLRWRIPPSADKAWHIGPDWSLGYDEP